MKRNRTADFLKGIATLMVLFYHYPWTSGQKMNPIFPFFLGLPVPIFLVVTGYVNAVSMKNRQMLSLSAMLRKEETIRKAIRFTVPFLFLLAWEMIDPHIQLNEPTFLYGLKWVLNGGYGPGSYYYEILIQSIFVFPVIWFIVYRKGTKGLLLCFLLNAAYEIIKWAYGMEDPLYKRLIFRYLFVIAAGAYGAEHEIKTIPALLMTLAGAIWIGLIKYGFYSSPFITMRKDTSYLACLYVIPAMVALLRKQKIHNRIIEYIGKASYHIFFVQMVYYYTYRLKMSIWISHWPLELLAGVAFCVLTGILFYHVEQPVTGWILSKTTVLLRNKNESENPA